MKYNYLLPLRLQNEKCKESSKIHSWSLTGLVKAMPGGYRSVDFYCKVCKKRHTEIYTQAEYENKVRTSVERVEKEKEKCVY